MATNTSVVLYDPQETSSEVKALAGFLAGYSGRTREAYTLDLRMLYRWCDEHRLELFNITRTHIELYARELEELGRDPATIGRRLSTLVGFYRYAAEEGVIEHSPAVHIAGPGSTTSPTPLAWPQRARRVPRRRRPVLNSGPCPVLAAGAQRAAYHRPGLMPTGRNPEEGER